MQDPDRTVVERSPRRLRGCGRLLHRPAVAVRVREEAEASPREFLYFGDLNAASPQERLDFVDVVDDKLCPLHRARLGLDPTLADRDGARRPRWGETNKAPV